MQIWTKFAYTQNGSELCDSLFLIPVNLCRCCILSVFFISIVNTTNVSLFYLINTWEVIAASKTILMCCIKILEFKLGQI